MRSRMIALVLFVTVFFSFGANVQAATTTSDTVEDATVNLYCSIKIAGRTYSVTGSGVFIHESGIILTNAHVGQYFLFGTSSGRLKVDCSVRDGSPARERYEASLVYLSRAWASSTAAATTKRQPEKGTGEADFALLKVSEAKRDKPPTSFPALPRGLGEDVFEDGEEVIAAGYPAEGLNFRGVQKKLRSVFASTTVIGIQSFERPYQDVLTLAPSNASASGVSGGPVIRSSQKLAGIAVTVKEGERSRDERSLRAITLSHIDRTLRTETGLSLEQYLQYAKYLAFNSNAAPYRELRNTIEKTLRNTRE